MIEETYCTETGDGDHGPEVDEATARAEARWSRSRLIRRVKEDGILVEDALVFDYAVGGGVDDTGARECDECEHWTVELIDPSHGDGCSLNPANITSQVA